MEIRSAIEKHLLENAGIFRPVLEGGTGIFDDMPVPDVSADNDFDDLVAKTEKILIITGATLDEELVSAIRYAKNHFEISPIDSSKIYSSDAFSLSGVISKRADAKDDDLSNVTDIELLSRIDSAKGLELLERYHETLSEFREIYLQFLAKKAEIFAPVIQLILSRNIVSNVRAALLNFDISFFSLYDFLSLLYDEALDANKEELKEEILKLCMHYSAMFPDFPGFHDLVGVACYNRGDFENAIYRWNIAKRCFAKGMDEEDIKREFIEKIDSLIASAEAKYVLHLGCSTVENDPEAALKYLTQCKPVFSDWWVHSYFSGLAYQRMGSHSSAINYYQKTLELNSGCHEAWERMAELYEIRGDYAVAFECLKSSLAIFPSNAEVLGKLILAADKIGQLGKVSRLISQAQKLDSANRYVLEAIRMLSERNLQSDGVPTVKKSKLEKKSSEQSEKSSGKKPIKRSAGTKKQRIDNGGAKNSSKK